MTEDERDHLLRYKRNNRIEKLILKKLESVLLKELKDKEFVKKWFVKNILITVVREL